jgi:hypothetical protein
MALHWVGGILGQGFLAKIMMKSTALSARITTPMKSKTVRVFQK